MTAKPAPGINHIQCKTVFPSSDIPLTLLLSAFSQKQQMKAFFIQAVVCFSITVSDFKDNNYAVRLKIL